MADVTESDLIDTDTARTIVEGRHGDPFSVLGAHMRGDDQIVCVFVPGATHVDARQGNHDIRLKPVVSAPGLFIGKTRTGRYSVRATAGEDSWSFEDPYRFGPVLGEMDEYLLGEGTHQRLWQALGAREITHEYHTGVHFAVWAPNADRVSVVGDFNFWDGRRNPMRKRGATGVWEIFMPGLTEGCTYKFDILGQGGRHLPMKADPVGFGSEHPPANASVVRSIAEARWADGKWMDTRLAHQNVDAPISIYEVHLGSWKRAEDGKRFLSYLELADELIDYVAEMGFTHIELMPISEFPFDGSWGYQPVGLFAPTIRHGTPPEFRAFIEAAHKKGIGVLLDWVPGHFPTDAHGLGRFDGTALYEHLDPKEGFHQDWNTLIYNYGRAEVSNYLISNALYWLEEYHLDGLRVDAVASMLYRDYSRDDGQWVPNKDGGRENYEAIALLQNMNVTTYGEVPGIMTVAEESTAFPGVSKPVDGGGLGFGFKWNMGWMNDSLSYMQNDPIHRKHHHHQMTFGMTYAWSENYILPISHDEVVHGKGSMILKMPGDEFEKFANLRAYYSYMWTHPGKKLLFMGCEFAQVAEWNNNVGLDWHLLEQGGHKGMQNLVRDLNHLLRATPALYLNDTRPEGFEWLEANDADRSVYAFIRRGGKDDPEVVVALNMTPVERRDYRLGLPGAGRWREALNTDAETYGGANRGNMGGVTAEDAPWHNQTHSAPVILPPLSALILIHDNSVKTAKAKTKTAAKTKTKTKN